MSKENEIKTTRKKRGNTGKIIGGLASVAAVVGAILLGGKKNS